MRSAQQSAVHAAPTALVVARDRALAQSLAHELDTAGFVVRLAHDGSAALAEVALDPPSIVVLDLDTPALHGEPLLHMFRRLPATRCAPLLALAALSYGDAAAAVRAGADDCLVKPLPADEIAAATSDLLARVVRWTAAQVWSPRQMARLRPPEQAGQPGQGSHAPTRAA